MLIYIDFSEAVFSCPGYMDMGRKGPNMTWKRFRSPWHQEEERLRSCMGYLRLGMGEYHRSIVEGKMLASREERDAWRSRLTSSQIQRIGFLRGHWGMADRIRYGARSVLPFRGRRERTTLQNKRRGHFAPPFRDDGSAYDRLYWPDVP